MSLDIVYTKKTLAERIEKRQAWELPSDAMEAITFHLSIANPRANRDEWALLAGQVLIAENEDWPNYTDITKELSAFLLAIRKGETAPAANTLLAYVESYRDWKRRNRTDSPQESQSTGWARIDPFALPMALTTKNYACEFEQCFLMITYPGDSVPTPVQKKRCLRDHLEGIELHLHEHKTHGTVSEFDAHLRGRYQEGLKLWHTLTGEKWQILQPRETGYLKAQV